MSRRPSASVIAAAAAWVAAVAPGFLAQEYKPTLAVDHPAIRYAEARGEGPLDELGRDLERGMAVLAPREDERTALTSILSRFDIGLDSQMLVFSKTSLQAPRVSPDHPRAIFFNDTTVVAYVPGAPTLEAITLHATQGPQFYVVGWNRPGPPRVERAETCLRCHQGPNTAGVPGIYVGSVVPGPTGAPLRDDSAIITDHRTPFADRWGGWYVTARRGEQRDRANAVAMDPSDPSMLVRESQQNITSLLGRFDLRPYAAATSDIVALMTFEHQTQMWNLLTRVGWEARMAEHEHAAADSDRRRALAADIDDLVGYMLFAGETPLPEPIEGVSSFRESFAARGPRDARGRSLRDFDLKTRLFRYPLSYMIYSAAFDALPDTVRTQVLDKVYAALTNPRASAKFSHLSAGDRQAIVEIVRETKRNLPPAWKGRT